MSEAMIQTMMQDAVPIEQIPALRGYSSDTVGGWVRRGRRAFSGRIVRLQAIRHPKKWLTTPDAVAKFFHQLMEETAEVSVA